MFIRGRLVNRLNHFNTFRVDGDDEGTGGGGGTTFTQADIDAAVSKAVNDTASKLSSKNTELLNSLKSTKEQLKAWEGLDPAAVRGVLSHFENDQDLKDIAEGKTNEVISRRVEKAEAQYKTQISTLANERDALADNYSKANQKIADLLINGSATALFASKGGDPEAVEDMQLRAKNTWKIEDGEAVMRDTNGQLVLGKNGPLSMEEWMDSLVTKAPHLFKASNGSDGHGNRGNTGNNGHDLLAIAKTDPKKYAEIRREQLRKKGAR